MKDPNLSLFDALIVGGFSYQDEQDPSSVDEENISLGQRKNQLSRRLRQAKKVAGAGGGGSEAMPDRNTDAARGLFAGNDGSVHSVHTGTPRQASLAQLGNLSGHKRRAEAYEGVASTIDAHTRSLKELQDRLSLEQQRQREEPAAMAAKYHPDFHHIIIPRAASGGIASFASPSVAPQPVAVSAPASEVTVPEQLMGFTGGGLAGLPTAKPPPTSVPPPSISNVAIRSLNSTAKSVGISLEQLALALSTSKNLVQLLTGINCEGNDSECQQKKYELALRLHEYETKTLYSRCMLLSGYSHADAAEGSTTQLRFALEAWQREGKRLQELIRNNSDAVCDEAPLVHDVAVAKTAPSALAEVLQKSRQAPSASAAGGGGHSRAITQPHQPSNSHNHDSGRHVHRLEGRCGHRAILHQPKGGTPHIDFLVGNRIECYGGIQPVRASGSSSSDRNTVWPSQYRCDELECTDAEQCSKAFAAEDEQVAGDVRNTAKAKVIDLNDIDLTTNEWNIDFDAGPINSLLDIKESDQPRADHLDNPDENDVGDGSSASDQRDAYKL